MRDQLRDTVLAFAADPGLLVAPRLPHRVVAQFVPYARGVGASRKPV